MKIIARSWPAAFVLAAATLSAAAPAAAQPHQLIAEDATRYMALGDSIPAGYKALPATDAYPYLLYGNETFDQVSHTLFCNAAVPGATSRDVLLHQVAQATIPFSEGGFNPAYVTLTVGGNDLLAILRFMQTHPDQNEVLAYGNAVLGQYGNNLGAAIAQLRAALPNARIFVGNQYALPEIEARVPLAAPMIAAFNSVVSQVLGNFPVNVYLVDVHAAFDGRPNVLLASRPGASPFETHMTTPGHRVMARAFAAVIDLYR
jgi:lysophospholipase L1-like esterase